jgi:phosphoribosylformylglycinamidine synthase subunit PurL
MGVPAVVVVFPGTNGDRDLFETLALVGFAPVYHSAAEPLPQGVRLVGLPGGFSYGDYWRAGVLASEAPAVRSIRTVIDDGGLCIGICNGFQILVEADLLPGALAYSDPPGFRHRWLNVSVKAGVSTPWLEGVPAGTVLRMPMAHGEGRYFHPGGAAAIRDRVPLTYTENPNGSLADAAGLLDETGRILGLMPHPERASESDLGSADGLKLFEAAFRWLSSRRRKLGSALRGSRMPPLAAAASLPAPGGVTLTNGEPRRFAAKELLGDGASDKLRAELGLSPAEHAAIKGNLGRLPTRSELFMFAGMWSEHCSYKSTKTLLATLPREGPAVLAGPGSHAGVVDVGGELAVAFKVESHNHPSAVEPYQGAATGVGGILRDVIAQGARPCAVLDGLCFGSSGDGRTRDLARGIVAGIAGYGNAFGVPNVGGLTLFDPRYEGNPLVNALAVGLVARDGMRTAAAHGVGNAVLYVGASTGRDGILGAAFASEELGKDTIEDRAHVQVGDPFSGRKLMEACLSFTPAMGLVACQDLGACGLTCAITEMAALGGMGMVVDLDLIPLREAGMTAHEILVSESQERFMFVVERERLGEAVAHFRRFGVHAVSVGEVTSDGRARVHYQGDWVADVEASFIAGGAPLQSWPAVSSLPACAPYLPFGMPEDAATVLLSLLATPGITDLTPLYAHYDQTVGNRTVRAPGAADAAVLKLGEGTRGFAICLTGPGTACAVDPYLGAQTAVCEGLRRLAAVGAEMLAVTDGLNCGSPRDPVEFRRLQEVVRGLGDALRAFAVPVTGGNVSLYNESSSGVIPPSPMIGCIGALPDVRRVSSYVANAGEVCLFVGRLPDTPVFSRYGAQQSKNALGDKPQVDLDAERRLAAFLVAVVRAGLVRAVRSCRAGGLAVAVAKLCSRSGVGATLSLPAVERADWLAFGEYPGQAVVVTNQETVEAVAAEAKRVGVAVWRAGKLGGDRLALGNLLSLPLAAVTSAYRPEGATW